MQKAKLLVNGRRFSPDFRNPCFPFSNSIFLLVPATQEKQSADDVLAEIAQIQERLAES